MPERKKRKTSTSRKGKKRTDVATHDEILPVKDLWEHTFDSMPDLVAILDDKHRIVRANKSMAQRLGVTPEQCIGLNCFKCVHKLDSPPSFCPHALTVADGKEHIAEVHEDNLGGDFLVSTTPLFDQKGKVIGSVHVARDITQRKKAEEEIKSLSRFPAENPNVVMRISKDGNILYSNNAGLTILNEWNCQVGQPVPSKWRQLVEDVFKSGMKKEFEEEHDNQTFLIMLAPVIEEGYVNAYGRDITERKRAEMALKQSEGKYRSIVETAQEGIMVANLDGRIVFANERIAQVLGYTVEELTAKTGLDLLPEREIVAAQERMKNRREGIKEQYEVCMRRKDGSEVYLLASGSPLFDAEGQHIGNLGMYTDITERKKAEEELRRAHEQLEMRVQERTIELSRASEKLQAASLYTRSLIEASLDPLVTINAEGKITDVNKATEESTGFSREQLIGSDFSDYFTSPEEARKGYRQVFAEGFVRDYPLVIRHKSGKTTDVLYNATVYRNEAGEMQGVFAAARDITERKKAEETAKAERKRFFDVLEKLPAYMVLLTPDYHVRYANLFFRERFGEDRGRRCFEYLFNRSEPCEPCETYKALKNMAPLEWEWTGPDRHNYYIYDSPFTDVDGSTLIMEVGIDVTERKKAEEALQKAQEELETRVEERTKELRQSTWKLQAEVTERKKAEEDLRETRNYLENLLDYANAPIIVWDSDYRITRFNHAFERLTGLKAEDVVSKPLEILFPENSKEESLNHIRKATSGARWETVEIPILRTDGLVRTVLWNSANILERDGTRVVATIAQGEDITERKQALESLRESQKDLNRAQAVAMTGSWRLDVRDNILRWSDETYRMFGIPKGTPLSYETFLSIVHPDDREYVDQQWQAAMKGEPYDIEHRIIVDGRVKWVREKAELEFNKDGVFLGGFGTVQEITEIKEMQAKLEQYSLHLEQLVEEKTQKLKEAERLVTIGETAGMVGHDIRNPLQSIEGAVYLAREELKTLPDGSSEKKELYEILEMIRHQSNYIDHIVADLQDFSRTPMPQIRETNLRELVTEALSTTEIPENIQIQTQIQDDLKTVTVDPVFMKRVFLNLIENAAHAMPKGGRLTIKAFREGERTFVHVEDTGAGISEENKPKIFTPLFTTKSKGQGFGLAVCKKLVEAHNGEITFESEAGKGTVFKIKLPQRKETA